LRYHALQARPVEADYHVVAYDGDGHALLARAADHLNGGGAVHVHHLLCIRYAVL
jgi:hypothetical protein